MNEEHFLAIDFEHFVDFRHRRASKKNRNISSICEGGVGAERVVGRSTDVRLSPILVTGKEVNRLRSITKTRSVDAFSFRGGRVDIGKEEEEEEESILERKEEEEEESI